MKIISKPLPPPKTSSVRHLLHFKLAELNFNFRMLTTRQEASESKPDKFSNRISTNSDIVFPFGLNKWFWFESRSNHRSALRTLLKFTSQTEPNCKLPDPFNSEFCLNSSTRFLFGSKFQHLKFWTLLGCPTWAMFSEHLGAKRLPKTAIANSRAQTFKQTICKFLIAIIPIAFVTETKRPNPSAFLRANGNSTAYAF